MLALARFVVAVVIPIEIVGLLMLTAMRALGSRLAQFAEIFHFAGCEKSVGVVRLVFARRCRLLLRAARTAASPAAPPASRRAFFATAFLSSIRFSLHLLIRDGLRAGLVVDLRGLTRGVTGGGFLAATGSPASAATASAASTVRSLLFRFAATFNGFAGLDLNLVNLFNFESFDPIVGRTLDERKMIVGLLGSLFMRFHWFFVPRSVLRPRMLATSAFIATA